LAITDEEKWAQPLKGEAAYSSGKSVSVGGGGAGATGAGDAAAASKKDSHDLKLVSFADGTKIKIIKEVRAATGLGLKEAKALVDGAPAVVKQGLTKDEADALLKVITDAGGVCELA
jgi:large subunit ribosomal protein L7/L12